jgi:hypothetical protein
MEVSEERALLHRCRYKLPFTKAEVELGYRPIVTFEEGCRRSVAWLTFAGYPVLSTQVEPAMDVDPDSMAKPGSKVQIT